MRRNLAFLALMLCAAIGQVVASQRPASISRAVQRTSTAPSTGGKRAPHQRLLLYQRALFARTIPPLAPRNKPVADSVNRFVARASMSGFAERERIRTVIEKDRTNDAAARALGAVAFESRTRDFTRTLTALSVLGEMRNPVGSQLLLRFIALPLPTQGHMVEGEITERVTLEKLQMKAVDGLAYARTRQADAQLLRIAASHPSRAVRAEAIAAYRFNHRDDPAARKTLLGAVRCNERPFIDQPYRLPGMTASVFNRQLNLFLARHRDLRPPRPVIAKRNPIMMQRDTAKERRMFRPVRRSPPLP